MKNTRKALLLSVMSLLVCISMLVGTTFAWFTDAVSTGKNVIAAGNLDVELEYYDLTAKTWKTVGTTTELFDDAALWEPGYTQVVHLKVSNKGSLALKYQLGVNIVSEKAGTLADGSTFMLSDFVKFGTIEANKIYTDRAQARADAKGVVDISAGYSDASVLYAANDANGKTPTEAYVTLVVYMPESVGNEANHATGEANKPAITLGVQLVATQLENEDDSFGTDYDKNADYSVDVATLAELEDALAYGGEIKLTGDIVLAEGEKVEIPEGVVATLDLGGNTITGGFQAGSTSKHVYPIENYGTLTLLNGTVEGRGVGNYGDLTIESGTYNAIDTNGGGTVWNYTGGNVTINGGTFTTADAATAPAATLLNVASGSSATINGGTFVANANQTYGIINSGSLTVNDINISADHGVLSSSGTMVLNGGTYQQNGNLVQTSSLIYISGGKTTINDGTYKFNVGGKLDSGLPVYCANGYVSITGGTFTGYVTEMISSWGGTGSASVTGGTFAKEPGFVAEGYGATENGDGTWTVDREYVTVAGSSTNDATTNGAALADAINATTEHTYLQLAEGEYKMPSISGDKEVTIVGTKDTVIDVTVGAYMDSATVSFEGVTIKGSTGYVYDANGNKGSDYAALYTPNVTYTNCTFSGPFRIGRDGATFINCTFNDLGNDYVWTYGNDCTFTGCTFNSEGKALLIYSDGGDEVAKVTVKNCVFNATKGATAWAIANINCAAIEIDNSGNGVDLTVSDCTVNAVSEELFSGLWRIKTHNGTDNDVFVNGVEYTTTALDGKKLTVVDRVATVVD